MFEPKNEDERRILRYLEKNYMLDFYNVYRGAGYIEIVPIDESGEPIYFWIDSVGAINSDRFPF